MDALRSEFDETVKFSFTAKVRSRLKRRLEDKIAEYIESLRERLEHGDVPSEEVPAESKPLEGNVFCREADYWTIVYERTLIRLRHRNGLAYIARLLAEPEREFQAIDLDPELQKIDPALIADAIHYKARLDPGVTAEGSTGYFEVLDPQAKRFLLDRKKDVEHKLEAAIATGNTTAEEEARKEMKWFVRELRPRNLDRTDEKAKRAVRMAITEASKA
jgi:hypothetical protein